MPNTVTSRNHKMRYLKPFLAGTFCLLPTECTAAIADIQSNNTGCVIMSALIATPLFFRGTYWFGDQIHQISQMKHTTKLQRLTRNARVIGVAAASAFGLIATPAIVGNGVATTYMNYHDRQQCGVKAPTRAQARACQRYWNSLQK